MALKIGNDKVDKVMGSLGIVTDVECKKIYQGINVVYARMQCLFNTGGGSYVAPRIVYYGEQFGTLPTTSRTGHDFDGWFTSTEYTTQIQTNTVIENTDYFTIYAKQTIQTFTVIFKDWNGTTLKTENVNYGSNATAPSNPTRTGYTFANWNDTYTNITSNKTITAVYNINTYQVQFMSYDNSETLKIETVNYGSNATPPTPPVITGYTFNDWYGSYTNVTSNRIINATYKINVYQVLFKDWNGTTLKTENVDYGSNATPPSDPSRTGYTFTGWSGTYTNITSNRTITAVYAIQTFTVIFRDWNSSILKTESVNYGSNATPPTDPSRTGYNFSGWSGTYTSVTSNRTITATYNINTFTVIFKNWDGTTLKTETVGYGYNATPPANPTRPSTAIYNYTFSSWSGTYTNITSNRTITATFASSFRPYVFSKPSITGILSYVVERVESPYAGAPNGVLNDNATVYYDDVIGSFSPIPESGYEVVNNSPGIVKGNISAASFLSAKPVPKATTWTVRYDTPTHHQTVDYAYTNNFVCPPESTARTWLNTNYPPSNYNIGYIMRVNSTKQNGVFCAYFYFEAT